METTLNKNTNIESGLGSDEDDSESEDGKITAAGAANEKRRQKREARKQKKDARREQAQVAGVKCQICGESFPSKTQAISHAKNVHFTKAGKRKAG